MSSNISINDVSCVMASGLTSSRLFIVTGFRIAALHRVNSGDFTYDEGYIGLLSIAGPLSAIICSSAIPILLLLRKARTLLSRLRNSISMIPPIHPSRYWETVLRKAVLRMCSILVARTPSKLADVESVAIVSCRPFTALEDKNAQPGSLVGPKEAATCPL